MFVNSENKHNKEQTENFSETTFILPEKTKRGPPTNKYISVRNIKAHITNMTVNENAGFKCEYQVKIVHII